MVEKKRKIRRREDMTSEETLRVTAVIDENVKALNKIGMTKVAQEDWVSGKSPLNPSYAATLRVSNPRPVPFQCDCCGSSNIACSHHDQIYGMMYSTWPWMIRCLDCDSRVGIHPFTNIPLGTMADATLRKARMDAKKAFQEKQTKRHWSTNEAYEWLARQLGIDVGECHFGWFNLETCHLAEQICKAENRKELMAVLKSA